MKHPSREEWVPFLWGETTVETKSRLSEHLQQCPECAAEVSAWRRTLNRLDGWEYPARPAGRFKALPLIKWAAAAALILGVGFGFGRFAIPSAPDINKLRADMESSLKTSLVPQLREQMRREIQAELDPAVALLRNQVTNQIQVQVASALDGAEKAARNISMREARRLLKEFVQVMDRNREEDRRTVLTLFEKFQNQYDTDYVNLRKDLETLASMTDDQFQQARLKLIQLAANSPADESEN